MYPTSQSNSWGMGLYLKTLGIMLTGSALIYASSFAIQKYNDDQKFKLTNNNLMLVKDNRELRKQLNKLESQLTTTNTKLDKLNKCLAEVK